MTDISIEKNEINLLIVEDDLVTAKIVELTLSNQPHINFVIVGRLDDGLAHLAENDTDVVLLDLNLPDSGGLDTFTQVHQHSPSVAIVIHTGSDDDSIALKAIKMGAQDYLVKGQINKALLPKMLSYAIERKAFEENLRLVSNELQELNSHLEDVIAVSNQRLVDAEVASAELEQIFNACSDGMWVVNQDFKIIRVNNTFTELLGLSQEEIIGHKCCDILNSSVCQKVDCPLISYENNITEVENDIEYTRPDGKSISLALSSRVFRGLGGQVIGIVENAKDITWRKQAEREMQRANQILKQLSSIDGLTQLSNRRSFNRALAIEWKRMAREKGCLSAIMCDVDFFKQYNDTYGHLLGDDCLKTIAKAISESSYRPQDLVARYGGEEFIILLPKTSNAGACRVADRIRMLVEECKIPHITSTVSEYVSLSLGVATIFPTAGVEPDVLIESADRAMYKAKSSGRNRYCA